MSLIRALQDSLPYVGDVNTRRFVYLLTVLCNLQVDYYVSASFGEQMFNSCKVRQPLSPIPPSSMYAHK
jgi:hypothetical protein